MQEQQQGKLIICPTPLGNLGDMTQRALDALRFANTVCAEDTRVSGRLLAAYGIEKRIERLDEALMSRQVLSVVNRVLAGETIAYCSDAGMPGISDPGSRLVRAAHEAGLKVEVLPGPSAVTTAYVCSGCSNPHFFFGGFFPRRDAERKTVLRNLYSLDAALIFYESPKRLVGALSVFAQVFPLRDITVCRELTKLHEEVVCQRTEKVWRHFVSRDAESGIKGEIVLVLDGPNAAERDAHSSDVEQRAQMRAHELKSKHKTQRDIMQALVEEFDVPRNKAYEWALKA